MIMMMTLLTTILKDVLFISLTNILHFDLLQENVLRSEVSGQLNMKSFLNGSPQIKLGLNEDLVIGREERHKGELRSVGTVAL